jgi:hypothetical protein
VFSTRPCQQNDVLVVHTSGEQKHKFRALNGDCREESDNKFKVQTAVDKVMAGLLCYSEWNIISGIPSDVCRR